MNNEIFSFKKDSFQFKKGEGMMKPSRCFQAIIMVIVLLLSGTCVYAQGPISGFYYPADEMIDDWEYYADRSLLI